MSTEKTKKKLSFTVTMAATLIILSFFLIFRSAISNLISGGDCLNMEFFGSKINTCEDSQAKETLDSEQKEISAFIKSLKSSIDSLEMVNNSLHSQVASLSSEMNNDSVASMMVLSLNSILTKEQNAKFEKYTSEPETISK